MSRVCMYYGLEKDAEMLTSKVWNTRSWSAFDCYLAYNSLLLSYRDGTDSNYFEKAKIAISKYGERDDTLRLRFMLAVQCGGYFGKLGNLEKVKFWRNFGSKILSKILDSSKFEDYEKHLLHSRWYRFSSFVPHLEKDYELLKLETTKYISLSYKAIEFHRDDYTIENLYAVYETRGRIAEAMNDIEGSLIWFLRLRNEIDSNDAKVEINIGSIQEKLGQHKNALDSYYRAYEKSPPLRDLALLKIANLEARLGRYWSASFNYSRLSELAPESKVAKEQLHHLVKEIVPIMGDSDDS